MKKIIFILKFLWSVATTDLKTEIQKMLEKEDTQAVDTQEAVTEVQPSTEETSPTQGATEQPSGDATESVEDPSAVIGDIEKDIELAGITLPKEVVTILMEGGKVADFIYSMLLKSHDAALVEKIQKIIELMKNGAEELEQAALAIKSLV